MIPSHDTWHVHDSTKIQCFMECPRKYFYTYVLGWQPTAPSVHLVFGEAWHHIMETFLRHGYSSDAIEKGYNKFLACYRQHFQDYEEESLEPKTPSQALAAAVAYCHHYDTDNFRIHHTEVAGSAMLDKELFLHFKSDAIIESEGKFFCLEHKTTSSFRDSWLNSWQLKFQVGAYHHLLYCLYSEEQVGGVTINGTMFSRGKPPEFLRFTVSKPPLAMEQWRQNAIRWIEAINREFDQLVYSNPESQVMSAFPQNTEACTHWGICPFHTFCQSPQWANPTQRADMIPAGYERRFWDPREREKEAREVVQI